MRKLLAFFFYVFAILLAVPGLGVIVEACRARLQTVEPSAWDLAFVYAQLTDIVRTEANAVLWLIWASLCVMIATLLLILTALDRL